MDRYEEALERAKKELASCGNGRTKMLERIFPELAESEDEKIRKRLISYFKSQLEARKNDSPEVLCTYNKWIVWLERQGEQKHQYKSRPRYIGEEELLGEQKPDDKVEPKFHKDDWIIYDGWTTQIKEVYEDGYSILHQGFIPKEREEEMRLWTIRDAKEGDALQLGKVTAIFKEFIDNKYCKCYCSVYNGGFEIPSQDSDDNCYGCDNATPATKEQCDTLIKAMADAGYTFDFDKKKLKKIVVPIFNIGDAIAKKHNSDINNFGSFTITDITGCKYWYNDRIICDITEQDDWELYKPIRQSSTKWSEEDERMFECALNMIEWYSGVDEDKSRPVSDWLKSLKDRVPPQSKLEWCEEDEEVINLVCSILYSNFNENENFDKNQMCIGEIIDKLESLKERCTWKPSDLPRWKKGTLPNDNTTGFNSDYFCYKGYNINYKELFEKLPKDD